METLIWFASGVVGFLVLRYLIRVIVGASTSIEVASRTYMKQGLAARGLDPHQVPGGCIDDFVQLAIKLAVAKHARTSNSEFRSAVVESLDSFADLFVLWLENPADPMFREDGFYREMFEKHDFRSHPRDLTT